MDEQPNYILPMGDPKVSEKIAEWWRKRWLMNRILSDDVLTQLSQHTLVLPIRHGACVALPIPSEEQSDLFDD